jgi:hypothetical protein
MTRFARYRQRGIANGWLLLIGIIVLIVVAVIALKAWQDFIADVDHKGYERGKQEEKAVWLVREDKQHREHQAEMQRILDEKNAAAAKHLADLAAAHTDYQKRRADNEKDKDRFVADVRAGRIVLRDPGAKPAACPAPRGSEGPTIDAALAGGDGAAPGGLSLKLSEFLWSEAVRADAIVDQLRLAQAELKAMYEACKNR